MVLILGITLSMIMMTTALHALGMKYGIQLVKQEDQGRWFWPASQNLRVTSVVFLMFCISMLESLLWSVPYLLFGVIDGFEKAFYFSMVTYTTLGYGDVVLPERWRLLGSFEAASGIIMFGWTTAIVMSAIRHIYFRDKDPTKFE